MNHFVLQDLFAVKVLSCTPADWLNGVLQIIHHCADTGEGPRPQTSAETPLLLINLLDLGHGNVSIKYSKRPLEDASDPQIDREDNIWGKDVQNRRQITTKPRKLMDSETEKISLV